MRTSLGRKMSRKSLLQSFMEYNNTSLAVKVKNIFFISLFVGYPYQGPKSWMGKLLSVGIACVGLPIFLLYVCLVGRFLGRHLETLYTKLACCNRKQNSDTGHVTKTRDVTSRYRKILHKIVDSTRKYLSTRSLP